MLDGGGGAAWSQKNMAPPPVWKPQLIPTPTSHLELQHKHPFGRAPTEAARGALTNRSKRGEGGGRGQVLAVARHDGLAPRRAQVASSLCQPAVGWFGLLLAAMRQCMAGSFPSRAVAALRVQEQGGSGSAVVLARPATCVKRRRRVERQGAAGQWIHPSSWIDQRSRSLPLPLHPTLYQFRSCGT